MQGSTTYYRLTTHTDIIIFVVYLRLIPIDSAHIKTFEDIACFCHYLAPFMSIEICIRKLYWAFPLMNDTPPRKSEIGI